MSRISLLRSRPSSAGRARRTRRHLEHEPLERRVLLSAAPVDMPIDSLLESTGQVEILDVQTALAGYSDGGVDPGDEFFQLDGLVEDGQSSLILSRYDPKSGTLDQLLTVDGEFIDGEFGGELFDGFSLLFGDGIFDLAADGDEPLGVEGTFEQTEVS